MSMDRHSAELGYGYAMCPQFIFANIYFIIPINCVATLINPDIFEKRRVF